MSRRSNFIDGNDNFREKNLRFVRNEFEENINQFFGGAGGGAGPEQTGNGAPPRDSIIVHPTPGNGNGEQKTFRSVEVDQRLQFLHQLGVKRSQAYALAVASLKVPDFNLRDIQRQKFRMSVEAGDSRQSEVDAFIMREIHAMIGSHQERPKERPNTPPPPCNIDWNGSRERSPPSFRHIPRNREPSSEHFGLVHRFDEQERNKHFRERNSNFEREDNFHERERNISRARQPQYFERNNNFRDTNPRFMGTSRNAITEDFCLNQRNERVRDGDRSIYKNNREPNNFNHSYNRHRKSPEHYLPNLKNNNIREEPRPRNFERNFETSNTNNFNEENRAVPQHMQEQNYCGADSERRRFNDERDEPRFYNEHEQNYREDNFFKQQSDFRARGQDLDERSRQQDDGGHGCFNFDSDSFGDNRNDRNQTIFNRNRYNPDYNAMLDTDGRLLDERRNVDHDFRDRTNRNFNNFQSSQMCNARNQTNWNNIDITGGQPNWNNIDNSRNQLHWNNDDNLRSFNCQGDMMQPNMNGSFPNRNSQSRNNFLDRAQPPKRNNATRGPLVNTPPGQRQMPNQPYKNHITKGPNTNRPTTSQAGKQDQQQPPSSRTGNIVVKKPISLAPIASKNGNNQQKLNTNSGANANRPQHPPTNRAVNPTAAAKIGFCVKSFKLNTNEKFFINVGQAPEVPGPKDLTDEELIAILESSTPGSFRVPMSISEVRNTKDRSNNTVEVCDIAINPKFLLKIKKSQLFYNFFLQIVAEALSEKYNIQITMGKTIVLTNRKFVGTLVAHRVRNDDIQRTDAAGVAPGPAGGVDKSIEGLQAKQPTSKPASLVQEIDEESAASIRNTWAKNREPQYKLRARVRDEIVDELHAELYLPNCVSSQEFSLDIGEDRILVESLKHGYIFDKFVNYRLNQERAQALFDKTSKMLQVRIPVRST